METRAEQRHEPLTEEEKKSTQIRSVAANIYKKVDLDKPTAEFLHEHFYKDPTLALAYYCCCSADPCDRIFNDKLKSDVDTSVIWDCISNLIRNPRGQEEAIECFYKGQAQHAPALWSGIWPSKGAKRLIAKRVFRARAGTSLIRVQSNGCMPWPHSRRLSFSSSLQQPPPSPSIFAP
jgi:hypothetical protein